MHASELENVYRNSSMSNYSLNDGVYIGDAAIQVKSLIL